MDDDAFLWTLNPNDAERARMDTAIASGTIRFSYLPQVGDISFLDFASLYPSIVTFRNISALEEKGPLPGLDESEQEIRTGVWTPKKQIETILDDDTDQELLSLCNDADEGEKQETKDNKRKRTVDDVDGDYANCV